jgi:hypothetical protein
MVLTRAARAVAASSNSPLGVTASGATRAHRPQAVHEPTSKIRVSAARLSAAPGHSAIMRSTFCRVNWLGRNAGGVGRDAAESSGLAG